MKKLFTLCASAAFAFTLSAQADISEGSMFVYTSDATQLVKQSSGYEFDINLGYAVRDNIVLGIGFDQNADHLENTSVNVSARYFWKGLFFQAAIGDVSNNLLDNVFSGSYDQMVIGYDQIVTGYDQIVTGYEQIQDTDKNGDPLFDGNGDPVLVDDMDNPIMGDDLDSPIYGDDMDNPIMGDDVDSPIMEDVERGRSFSAGVGYLMQLDNVFDGGIPSKLYIEPYLGVLSSTSDETVSFSTALSIGYRF